MDRATTAKLPAGQIDAVGHPLANRLFGREKEQAALRRLWADTKSRGVVVGLLLGPAGFGKTALLQDFLATIAPTAALQTRCAADEATVMYGVITQLLAGTTRSLPGPLAQLVAGDPTYLDPLLVGAARLRFLSAASAGGLVVAVDDIQWADPPSVRALVFALRRMRTDQALAIVGCRDENLSGLPPGLLRLLNDVSARVELRGLQIDDTLAMASHLGRGDMTRTAAARTVEYSGGSPLHLRALLREFTVRELVSDADAPMPAPQSYADVIGARMARGSGDAWALVEAAALLAVTASVGSLRHRVAASVGFDAILADDVAAQAAIDAGHGAWILATARPSSGWRPTTRSSSRLRWRFGKQYSRG